MSLFNKKYKVGDKVVFYEGLTSHEIEIVSKRGAVAMNKHQPKTLSEFREFTQRQKKNKKKR